MNDTKERPRHKSPAFLRSCSGNCCREPARSFKCSFPTKEHSYECKRHSPRAAMRTAIRPFHVNVPEAQLTELRRRVKATVWPEMETVPDASQGVQLATVQNLARYWATEYDWRKVEARLNALPKFLTEIDGLEIHFIHVRSKHKERVANHRHARLAGLDRRAA